MISGSVTEFSNVIGARLQGPAATIRGVSIDSRKLPRQALFVALPGERVDGHDYVAAAAAAGAGAAMVQRYVDSTITQLKCDDAALGLGRLARHWRSRFNLPLVGITGSNGKTSVKTMLASILNQRHNVLVTPGNLNNELGVPLTLCGLSAEHEYAVVEMGAGKPGDIDYLAQLASPDVALINNAGPAHLEGMGDLAGVARTKGEMLGALGPDGVAILNADDSFFDYWKDQAGKRRVISFGLEQPAQVSGRWQTAGSSSIDMVLVTATGDVPISLKCRGEHNVANALAASAAALALGLDLEQIKAGLEAFEPVDGRLKMATLNIGLKLLQDSYNANPASMSAGLKVLASQDGQRWLVMGDMRELGADAEALHFQVGSEAARLGIDRIFALGPLSRHAVAGFGSANARHFTQLEALADALVESIEDAGNPGEVLVLLKGSRGMAMERVIDALSERGVA